ncbi:integrin alpha-3b [Chanos chanos]|uniref:Integrin alpha-3b n=1 Tax=Chanos chanos TaxID=29144 RepID=A0A6J2VA62_CHACN|nr:integrin alpha-3 [Chanos chanos]
MNMALNTQCCCILTFYLIYTCCGFNIDVRFPVIKEGKTKGSFFGFSVAMHHQTEGTKRYLLLAGAPKETAPTLPTVNETGAVYACPISTDQNDCTRMDLVTSTDPSEMVEGMWLGVTVASQREQPSGRVLACGHRYVKVIPGGTEDQRRMVGKCYVRGNDLTFDVTDDWQAHTYEVCNPNFGMELEGMCNMGISGGMTETDVYIGAPGSYVWQGNVHVTWRDPTPGNSWDSNDKDFGELEKRYSYMGYSVYEDKMILSRDEYTVVTGSPRDKAKGSVTLAQKQDKKLFTILTIYGEQVGSYFGCSIAVTDLNNDDWKDLIVGAPFYFDRHKDEGGAVYIFMNENGSFQKNASIVLKGSGGSAFGFAVAAIGDVNQDGFQDFAVGAPFSDPGKVFIWMGSKEGIIGNASQVIDGKEVGPLPLRTFGYSISGGMDVDGNKYPDILVGSLDDRIALLRSRPVIHLSKNFTVEPKVVDPANCVGACVKVKVCFAFILSNGNKDFKRNITIKYSIEADRYRRSARVRFRGNQDTYTNSISFSSSICQEHELSVDTPVLDKLQPVVFALNVSLQEQKAKARRSLQNLDAFPVLSGAQYLTERAEINFQKECGPDNRCSSNLKLKAYYANEQLDRFRRKNSSQTMEYSYHMKKLVLRVDVTNFSERDRGIEAEDAHQATLNITIPPTLSYSGVRFQEQQHTDISCSPGDTVMSVICELGNPLKPNTEVTLNLIFEMSDITLYTERIVTQLQLSTLSEQSDLHPVPVILNVENTIITSFLIERPVVDTFFSGTVMGESAMNSTSDVGSPVEYVFQIEVRGKPLGELGTLVVDFEWPNEVKNGKWLLYLTEIVTRVVHGSEVYDSPCVPPGPQVVNELNLTLSDRVPRRHKREVEFGHTEASVTLLTTRKETHRLECSLDTARCITFSCPLLNMSTKAELIVRSRVWNSTMLEDYRNALRVTVRGHATLRLETDKPTIKMKSRDVEFTVNIDPALGEEIPYQVPLWIIIVAAVAGILLLGLISLILWKCGFFKRAVYYRIMPKYHGVRIGKEERYQYNMAFQPEEINKKLWMTSWTEMECYYY